MTKQPDPNPFQKLLAEAKVETYRAALRLDDMIHAQLEAPGLPNPRIIWDLASPSTARGRRALPDPLAD